MWLGQTHEQSSRPYLFKPLAGRKRNSKMLFSSRSHAHLKSFSSNPLKGCTCKERTVLCWRVKESLPVRALQYDCQKLAPRRPRAQDCCVGRLPKGSVAVQSASRWARQLLNLARYRPERVERAGSGGGGEIPGVPAVQSLSWRGSKLGPFA